MKIPKVVIKNNQKYEFVKRNNERFYIKIKSTDTRKHSVCIN
jgi:hypothetical protein